MMETPLQGSPAIRDTLGLQVYAMLDQALRRPPQAAERRQAKRRPLVTALTVWFSDPWSPLPRTCEIDVATLNVSMAGFSFLADRLIQRGSEVRARFNVLPQRPVTMGLVRSCEHIGGACHRVGVEFAAPPQVS